ncbi:PqqD family protein [Brevibacillus sp. B_LB10_24]|uniref:PqqD family protein n=1 Tax=Brevibacillus sp. B_LB10_24 TaxID=3380645 RepID=UPI0038BA4533
MVPAAKKRPVPNMLEMSPILRGGLRLETNGDSHTLIVPRTSWLERLSVRFLNQPAFFRIQLDDLGSWVIRHCNGSHTVKEIAELVSKKFADKAEPVVPRLIIFLKMVEGNGWIRWVNAKDW